jgi:hypothetical protein
MNWSSDGEMRKNEMFAESAPPSDGYFSSKRAFVCLTSFGLSTTCASPVAWIPFVPRKSAVYSSIANETVGFCSMCFAVDVSGRVQT